MKNFNFCFKISITIKIVLGHIVRKVKIILKDKVNFFDSILYILDYTTLKFIFI
jgi:hypothetical protein